MSRRFLSLNPEEVGGASAKASFAKALALRCVEADRIDALIDVLLSSRQHVDPRVRDASSLYGREEIAPGGRLGSFTVVRKLGEGPLSIVYLARRDDVSSVLKVLRREVSRDRRAVQRLLTANRMVAALESPGLPEGLEAGEADGFYYLRYLYVDAQPLSARFARTGPSPIGDLRPILRGILEPLATLHRARMAHGDLKLENVLVSREQGDPRVTLIDFGMDRLRQGAAFENGRSGVLAVFGSPKTIAPEQVRGQRAAPATDIYAFGALLYELLTGKPVFPFETETDAAFAHMTKIADPPSVRGPRGFIGRDVDAFVLSLLAKNPDKRPKDASSLLDAIDSLGRGTQSVRPHVPAFPDDELTGLVDALIAAPDDPQASSDLEASLERGADAAQVAEAFEVAARGVDDDGADEQFREVKKTLLRHAARTFELAVGDRERAERVYRSIVELDPTDRGAQMDLETVRKSLGRYAEVVESLISRSEAAAPGEDRSRIFAEIGHLCAGVMDDPDQGILAYARALCETPMKVDLAGEIEHLAEDKAPLWNEVLATVTEGIQSELLSSVEKNKLLAYAGRWYEQKLGRADLAQMAYRQILATDSGSEEAHEGLTRICRKAQQWPELVAALTARAEAEGATPRARELRTEAAELLELSLNDAPRAAALYGSVLDEDPGHEKASRGMARLAEARGDYAAVAKVFERRAETESGRAKAESLVLAGEAYEQQLEDLTAAEERYRAALSIEPDDGRARKGLDRIYNRVGRYGELLENLELQLNSASTPRQKANVYERMAGLYEEEFLDHARAAECLGQVLSLDSTNESALSKLPRLCRALADWEALEKIYDARARVAVDDEQRVDFLMQRARVLVDNVGSPERAARVFEQVLGFNPNHMGALEALARLREQAGEAQAALKAIETLAASTGCAPPACSREPVTATAQSSGTSWPSSATPLTERLRRRYGTPTPSAEMPPACALSSRKSSNAPRERSLALGSTENSRACSERSYTTTSKPKRARRRPSNSIRRIRTPSSFLATLPTSESVTSRLANISSRWLCVRVRSSKMTPYASLSAMSRRSAALSPPAARSRRVTSAARPRHIRSSRGSPGLEPLSRHSKISPPTTRTQWRALAA